MKMTRSDKLILEDLQDRYGIEAITDAIVKIANTSTIPMQSNPEDCECDCECECSCKCECGASPEEGILLFIKQLEGYRLRLREIHWSATHNSLHELAGSFIDYLEELEDSIAEDMMGFAQVRIKPGEVVPVNTGVQTMEALLEELETNALTLRCCIEDIKNYAGIVSKIDDLISEIHKTKYLSTME